MKDLQKGIWKRARNEKDWFIPRREKIKNKDTSYVRTQKSDSK